VPIELLPTAPSVTSDGAVVSASGRVRLPPEGIALTEVERELVVQALERSGGNKAQAARLLKIPRHVLLYRLEQYGIGRRSDEKDR